MYKIAQGANNAGALVALHLLNPPLFWRYAVGVNSECHPYTKREIDGNEEPRAVGLYWVKWTFFKLDEEEMYYLITNFGPDVTIETYDKLTRTFRQFSGKMWPPEPFTEGAQAELTYWLNATFEFHRLTEVAS